MGVVNNVWAFVGIRRTHLQTTLCRVPLFLFKVKRFAGEREGWTDREDPMVIDFWCNHGKHRSVGIACLAEGLLTREANRGLVLVSAALTTLYVFSK